MNQSATSMTSAASKYSSRGYWERLWRTAGIQFVVLFIIAYVTYGYQPGVGASAEELVAFYDGNRTRIFIAAVLSGMAILNLMWFAAAIRATLAEAGQDGWGAAATASSAVVGGAVPPAHDDGRGARVLDRRLRKRCTRIGTERLRLGLRRDDLVPARDADHVGSVRALAGRLDLERAVRGGGRRRRARPAGRHHVDRPMDSGHRTAPIRGSSRRSSTSCGFWS